MQTSNIQAQHNHDNSLTDTSTTTDPPTPWGQQACGIVVVPPSFPSCCPPPCRFQVRCRPPAPRGNVRAVPLKSRREQKTNFFSKTDLPKDTQSAVEITKNGLPLSRKLHGEDFSPHPEKSVSWASSGTFPYVSRTVPATFLACFTRCTPTFVFHHFGVPLGLPFAAQGAQKLPRD